MHDLSEFLKGGSILTGTTAALGADDNYVTDAEKAALHAAATVSTVKEYAP